MRKTQRTLFSLTDGVDFTNNTLGSLSMVLCGQRPGSNSTNSTHTRASSRAMPEQRDRSSQQPTQRNASKSSQSSEKWTKMQWLNFIFTWRNEKLATPCQHFPPSSSINCSMSGPLGADYPYLLLWLHSSCCFCQRVNSACVTYWRQTTQLCVSLY